MEPGDYFTNVLSSNNYGSIQYEYFESQTSSSAGIWKHLQRVEAKWRKEGILVHCDPFKDGIWIYQNAAGSAPSSQEPIATTSTIVDTSTMDLVLRDKGTYEPASLSKNKLLSATSISASSVNSSPSSLENSIRNVQSINSRAIQVNSNYNVVNEPPTPPPGTRSIASAGESYPYLKHIHDCFISAVLGSVVYFLCRDYGYIPLNSRTLLLASPKFSPRQCHKHNQMEGGNTITLATLDISLTTLGALVVKASSDTAPGLLSVASSPVPPSGSYPNISPGTALWLAPGGNAAKFFGTQQEKKLSANLLISHLQANTVDHRQHGFNGATIQSWQTKCLEWLAEKGLNTTELEEGGWVLVQVLSGSSPYFNSDFQGNPMLEALTIVPWPALLCFQTTNTSNREFHPIAAKNSQLDPLSFAEEWFTNKDERANVITRRQKERQLAEARAKEQADVDARNLQSITQSPAALRRGSVSGAVYPTPPDAVHNPLGATPSLDGGVSTPGNPNQLFTNELDTTSTNAIPGTAGQDSDVWDSSDKIERGATNMNFHGNDNDNDVLFRDATADLFGDVTDADFSFFDEPDMIQVDPQTTSPGNMALGIQETRQEQEISALDSEDASFSNAPRAILDANDDVSSAQHEKPESPMKINVPNGPAEHEISENTLETSEAAINPPIQEPFNKEAVFQRLFQGERLQKQSSTPRRLSAFNAVDFESSLISVNKKYGSTGRFRFSEKGKRLQHVASPSIPKTDYLSRRRKLTHNENEWINLAKLLHQEESGILDHPPEDDQSMLYLVDIDHTSVTSEQDDTSHTTDDLSLALKPGIKRKWAMDEDRDDMTSSFDALLMDYPQSASTPLSISGSQIPLLEGDPADWSLTTYFNSPEPDIQSTALTDLEYIATAQILGDQAVSGTVKIPGSSSLGNDLQLSDLRVAATRTLMHSLATSTNACLGDISNCTLRSFLEIQGIPVLNHGLRLPPRPNTNHKGAVVDHLRASNPFPITSPQLEVRRADSKLSVLPSAVSFWENLSLSPSCGSKDVNAVCVFPNFDGVAGNAAIFLDQMRSVYESSRLGGHDKVSCKDVSDGLVPYNTDAGQQTSKMHHLTALKEATARLGRALASLSVEEKNFVVYFVYPVDNSALLVHICSAFQHLFNMYRKALSDRKISVANELVLQLVPLDFVASHTCLVVPSPTEYARLAMEVFDRCIDFTSASSNPGILLEQPLPKNIDFKLNVNPSASLLQENSCLHIAYAQSIDDRWITAAWTDNRGTQQMTASYCLGRKNEQISMAFPAVAHEIWETTLEIISGKKIHWRIMIARVGVMDPSEVEFWAGLASTESNVPVNLTLVTVQTDPSLRLLPAPSTLSPVSNAPQAVVTPVSTPQTAPAAVLSPEAVGTPSREPASAATPIDGNAEPDSDARLLDYTDQSWGAVLSHRLNNSNSLLELNPALISGYLIKNGGTNSDDQPVVMEVNIVYSEIAGNPRTFHENLLREILGYYRNLGTLARVRGVVDSVKDIRPWHIAAAEKAVKALYMLM
ncbi:hypothetical protein OIDMADRAFT_103853 [Oidiodendron maius Zn]|uniref:Mediator of RNA polymerase II transcription subunit 13 n=1 Tax=Oidiodendron maius (strain Zn) TaxID=913774 RepID=A0A0C3DGV0_OIDMZ|nr:hypothetical protein OIDMADRAFT_103853 [Oidiodendron maius Zn]